MTAENKMRMKKHSRFASGLLNILKDDISLIRIDVEQGNIASLKDSIEETKDTLQRILDTIVELDYEVYLAEQSISRKKQAHL